METPTILNIDELVTRAKIHIQGTLDNMIAIANTCAKQREEIKQLVLTLKTIEKIRATEQVHGIDHITDLCRKALMGYRE